MTDNADRLRDVLLARLRMLGLSVGFDLPGWSWHVESNDSLHSTFSGQLVIEGPGHDDAAVLSMTHDARTARWMIDAVGIDAIWLGDSRDIPDGLNDLMSADPEVADWVLRVVGHRMLAEVVAHLKASEPSLESSVE